jgi:predicted DNA-binding transcriptional regulator AlpA
MIRKLRKRAVAERYGVDRRTVDRWTRDGNLAFPQPLYINKTPYWDEAQLEAFERGRAKSGRPASQNSNRELFNGNP